MKNSFMKTTLVIVSLFYFVLANANENQFQDRDILENAKRKNYVNGAEESELRVQAQLQKPQRKISPVIEKKESENESTVDRD
jgi:hypothetical protein